MASRRHKMDFKLLVTTKMLMEVLSAGKSSAEIIGEKAEAKVRVGSRVFWYLPKIEKYLKENASDDGRLK
jgi:hypothetical protein